MNQKIIEKMFLPNIRVESALALQSRFAFRVRVYGEKTCAFNFSEMLVVIDIPI